MSGFTDLFGGGTLQAADVSFAAIPLTGNLVTFWPPAAVGTDQALPRLADVTAAGAGFTLYLPDATEVSAGQDLFCFNAGTNSFTVADYSGAALAVIAPGTQRYFYLVSNATVGGTWRSILMGVGAASNDASQLAGLGLKAIGASLNQATPLALISANSTFGASDRGKVFVNSGGSITATLPLTSDTNVGSDFFLELRNQGTGAVTVSPAGGELIDGSANIALNINESCFVHSGVGAWYTVGRGRNAQFNFTQLVKAVTGGSDVLSLTEASNVVQTYTGVLTSNEVVTLPAMVQVYYVSNQTTGAFSFTLQTAGGGSTLGLPSGQNAVVFCDGTNVINASTSIGGISSLLLNLGSVAAPSLAIGATNNGLFGPSTVTVAVSAGGVEPIRWNASGQGLAANGAAALPAYSFKTSPSTGWYSPSADSLGLATAGTLRLQASAVGNFGIGAVPVVGTTLLLGKNITGATTAHAAYADALVQSDVAGPAFGFRSHLGTQAAAFVLNALAHFGAYGGTVGAGSSIGANYGFYADSSLSAMATLNYGFYGALTAGASKWNLYMAGTAQNFLAGNLGVGTGASAPNMPFQLGTFGGLDGNANQLIIRDNSYFSGGAKYLANGFATEIDMNTSDGNIVFFTAPTGLAGAALTLGEKLRLNNAGSLLPGSDNAQPLGSVAKRWSALYATDVVASTLNGGPLAGLRNLVTNGGFTINQRLYASGGVLAAGSFGHDRWKAGAAGGDYSFTQLASDTQITIAAGKTLIQVFTAKDVQYTDYVISWQGTAQARFAVNSAVPAGAYAASPVLITGQTAGNLMSIEFNTGTLGKVQVERGTVATTFERRPYAVELALCLHHCFPLVGGYAGFANGTQSAEFAFSFPVPMYATPALSATVTVHTVSDLISSTHNPDSVSLTTVTATPYAASFRVNQFGVGASAALNSGQGLVGSCSTNPYGYFTTGY